MISRKNGKPHSEHTQHATEITGKDDNNAAKQLYMIQVSCHPHCIVLKLRYHSVSQVPIDKGWEGEV